MGIGTYTFEADGGMITFFRSPDGSCPGKFNRTVKPAKMFTGLDLMMKRYADKGGFTTLDARPPETLFGITAHEFTRFIRRHAGSRFTPKDLRTLRANIEAWKSFSLHKDELVRVRTKPAFNALVRQVCIDVSEKLNNTASVCKTGYIDPYLWDYMYDTAFPEK